ncbi:alpha/beta hydrolase [Amycolatopsis nigrescens]|uniref:alpha/beta hydrolase n=1 Tax=Amycolatopsis nigrescens TaxID=381445 RepID=UPI001B7F95FC|nr:alpha/beta hydrolase [Amycolatopsis nigrescens]
MPLLRKTLICALAALLLLIGTPVAAAENALVVRADAAGTPVLDWSPCTEAGLERYQCAVAEVPLDYTRPQREKLPLAVIRQPAVDPAHRIGTLFTAVGGPGGSGFDAAKGGPLADGELARRFDVVTFDQRGIGRSRQVSCFASPEDQERFWAATVLPPANAGEERKAEQASRAHARGCAEHDGRLLAHLTTADAAMDLDLLRRAVGDRKMTFSGGSYASYLGEVYGALFGDRVRALQLNAMIDPDEYTNRTLETLWRRSAGTVEVLNEFGRLCTEAGAARCPLAGNTLARNAAVLDTLKRGPITVGRGGDALELHYRDVVPLHAQLLYDTGQGWPALAELIAGLELGPDGDPAPLREIFAATAFRLDFLDSYTAISCADNSFPRTPGLWPSLVRAFDAHAPVYGRHWLYQLQACASWPSPPGGFPQRYRGPWTLRSETPALLINNRFDPVTSVEFAYDARRQLGNVRLVVVDGHGHNPLGSACTDQLRERYLIDLRLPAPDVRCFPDHQPFATGARLAG